MSRQTYDRPYQWIVVDDCVVETVMHREQEWIRPFDRWHGQNTLARNLRAALQFVRGDRIVFVEDDDYYGPDYLAAMDDILSHQPIAGQRPARYYNVAHARYREFQNISHASLCQTGIRIEVRTLFERMLAVQPSAVDFGLWSCFRDMPPVIGNSVVGIKGMPGRKGIGIGHDATGEGWTDDPDGSKLREWCGLDAEQYAPYCGVLI